MGDDRAVSVAVTHVLTIGITTVLISGLLLGAGNMLDLERDRAGEKELRSIGDRVATEMVTASQQGERANSTVEIRTHHRSNVLGGGYTVQLEELGPDEECFAREYGDGAGCLVIEGSGSDLEVEVPVVPPENVEIEEGSASGGNIVVVYEPDSDPDDPGTISIERGDR